MEKRELTCIGCPLGCSITVTLENGEIKDVAGYTCKRGHDYARKEVTNPTRIVTSTVRLTGSATGAAVVSCKTAQDIPKGKIFEIVAALRQVTAHAPVKIEIAGIFAVAVQNHKFHGSLRHLQYNLYVS